MPAKLKRVEENDVPSFLWRSVPDEAALAALPESERIGSEHDSRQVFDRLAGTWTYWGWKGGYFDREEDAEAFYDELRYMLATQKAAPNSPQWFNTGLHWAYGIDGPSQGHYYVDYRTGQLRRLRDRLRAPAAARLLHPGDQRRPRQRGRHHGPLGARGAPVQVRLRHRHQLLRAPRRGRAALRRRPLLGPDVVPQDRRPRRRRDQVGRHHAPRRQDGGGRRRPSRHRALHQLEGEGGAEGRRPRHRLEDHRPAPQGDHEGLRQLRGRRRRLLRSPEEPGAEARGPRRQEGAGARRTTSAASSSSRGRATPTSTSRSTTPTGIRKPTSPSPARTRTTPSASPTSSSTPSRPTATGSSTAAPPAR